MRRFFKDIIKKLLSLYDLKLINVSKQEKKDLPVEINKNIKEFINISNKFSMTGKKRMYLLSQAILNTKNHELEGDFVECGVWRGGNILLFKLLNDFYNLDKTIYAYDTFDGMTIPEEIDKDHKGKFASKRMESQQKSEDIQNIHAFAKIDTVKNNISKYTNLNKIRFVEGPVEETLMSEKNLPSKISVLRLDTDWYKSTKIELNYLYPRLVKGGVLIIDDYGHFEGARKAVDEYFSGKKWLHVVDYTCRYIIKD
tara:strand:+ start:90 stop:854 length:765 start_codon:yes stop_codon:yes gene_type:complete